MYGNFYWPHHRICHQFSNTLRVIFGDVNEAGSGRGRGQEHEAEAEAEANIVF